MFWFVPDSIVLIVTQNSKIHEFNVTRSRVGIDFGAGRIAITRFRTTTLPLAVFSFYLVSFTGSVVSFATGAKFPRSGSFGAVVNSWNDEDEGQW